MRRIQHCPYSPEPKKNGTKAQSPLLQDNSQKLTNKEIKKVQKIVGNILYYAKAVDMAVFMALILIAIKQTKGTERTWEKAYQVLDYFASHPDTVKDFEHQIWCWTSIRMHHIWASQKLVAKRAAIFFMGSVPSDGKPIKHNGAFHMMCLILRCVVVSAAEAELRALFMNFQEGMIF